MVVEKTPDVFSAKAKNGGFTTAVTVVLRPRLCWSHAGG